MIIVCKLLYPELDRQNKTLIIKTSLLYNDVDLHKILEAGGGVSTGRVYPDAMFTQSYTKTEFNDSCIIVLLADEIGPLALRPWDIYLERAEDTSRFYKQFNISLLHIYILCPYVLWTRLEKQFKQSLNFLLQQILNVTFILQLQWSYWHQGGLMFS